MNKRNAVLAVVGILVLVGLGVYLTQGPQTPPPAPSPDKAPSANTVAQAQPDAVSFRLKWRYGASSCGALLAESQGFFKAQNLDIKISQGGFEFDSKKLVASGTDQIGLTGADELILARSNEMPLVAIGADYQSTPCCILARADSNVKTPQDLAGKKLGVRKNTNAEYQYWVMMKRLGLDQSKVTEEPIKFDITRIVEGKLDMWTTYVSEKPIAEAKGLKINTVRYADHGVKSYGNVLFTSESFQREKPEVLKRFVKAYYEGWQWGLDNPERVGEAVQKFDPEASTETENAIFALIAPLLRTESAQRLGAMTEGMWTETQKVLMDAGKLEQELDVTSLFTNEFLTND